MSSIRILIVLSLLFSASTAFGWGQNGHRVVGKIAESHLTSKAKLAVYGLLKNERLARASIWADQIKSHPDQKYYGKFRPWHYVDFPNGAVYDPATASPNGDILEALGRMEKRLRDPKTSRENKIEALRLMVHFAGDIHQPLHVGNGNDRGGNWCYVKWFGKAFTNLHSVWDTELVQFKKLSYTEIASDINHPSAQEVAEWQKVDFIDWAIESSQLRKTIYPGTNRDYCKSSSSDSIAEDVQPELSYAYEFTFKNALEKRLVQAGVRLAGKLNSIFK